ncbi:nuclear transport factor 2 family protein [Micromonospora sp. IBHARD004]|uniref:nuclear transport factor 2 family protein n=1 Tax=Micromonospora sp. IBHARD004 TaxID=3457764 RepID=UPI004058EE45
MPEPLIPRDVAHRLLDGVVALVTGDRAQIDRLAALYAERTHVAHPMAPLGDTPLLTREDVREHFANGIPAGTPVLAGFRAEDIHLHETTDPEVVVVEFVYRGDGAGNPFEVPCVFVLRVRDGQIVASRDYVNHLEFARIHGGLGHLLRAMESRTAATP